MAKTQVYCGMVVHSTRKDCLKILQNHAIGVKEGKIVFIEELKKFQQKVNEKDHEVIKIGKNGFLMPGMIDTHIHAPQYPNAGKGLDRGLLEWLTTYTFPTEAKFKDLEFAKSAYNRVVRRTLENGTTTACYYGTIHTEACLVLCDIIEENGQRALVGKVNMNANSPEYYIEESVDKSISETRKFVDDVLQKKYARVLPIITPRFAISCSQQLMDALGLLAIEKDLHVQTHISETKDECESVGKMYPDYEDYLDVYDKAGLIHGKTVLAHGIYLSEKERKKIKEKGASISHCPNSNLSIRSGIFNARQCLSEGIKVGLGTDVSGGYSPSILDAMRTAIHTSNMWAIKDPTHKPINHREAFMMATYGGSQALAIDHLCGNFEVGKEFDALLIKLDCPGSQIDIFEEDSLEDLVQKFIYLGDSRNIQKVFVKGEDVLQRSIAENGSQE
ncbi:guanine deaminase-like [Saccostrea echinata]|uniref:guanine deaminase-like n=1 Tax=Saccostrea echinata TaxID=191078 RepID=UPI002A820CF7|nr:guanine deaminase-like [Saccostrea echinata]